MRSNTSHSRLEILGKLAGLLLIVVTLLGGLGACSPGSSTAYAPDGPFLHEAIKLAGARTHKAYAILLCKVADVADTPISIAAVKKLFLKDGQGTGNIYDYFLNMSYGSIDLDGSIVLGWYTMTSTKAQLDKRFNGAPVDRSQTDADCVQAAATKDGFTRSSWDGIVTIINIPTDSGNESGNGVVIGFPYDENRTPTFAPSFIEHEMGHALTLNHSMSMNSDGGPVHTWSPGGDAEYGDCWDIMSAMGCTFGYEAHTYGRSGPELEAVYRDQLGWMPSDRIYSYPGTGKATVVLAPVNTPRLGGSLLAKIPVSGLGSYTVEFRHKSDWDQGIPHDTVLIHELRVNSNLAYSKDSAGKPIPDTSIRTFLVGRSNFSSWLPGQVFQDTTNKVRISIDSFSGSTASITISNDVGAPPGAGTGGDPNCDAIVGSETTPFDMRYIPIVSGCTPDVTLTAPAIPAKRYDGSPIAFAATVTNPVGDTLPDSNVVWTANGAPLGAGRSFSARLPKPGTYAIQVTATNSVGLQGIRGHELILCDDATCTPEVHITTPPTGSHVHAGVSFTLSGTVYNPEKEDIADDHVTWTANSATLGLGRTLTTSIATPGSYTVTLSATNPLGYTGSASMTLIVDPPTSAPSVSITSPVDTLYTDVGSAGQTVTLQADGSAGVNQFDWSDSIQGSLGSGQTRTVTLYPTSTTNCALTTHVITVTGTRDDGQKATAHVTVTLRATCIR